MTATNSNTCTATDCNNEISRGGLCQGHYQKQWRANKKAKRAAAAAADTAANNDPAIFTPQPEPATVTQTQIASTPVEQTTDEAKRTAAIELLLSGGGNDEELRKIVASVQQRLDSVEVVATTAAAGIDTVREDVKAAVADMLPPVVRVEIVAPGKSSGVVKSSIAHKMYSEMVECAVAREHIYCYGPSGTGKTHAALQLAEDLSLSFYATEPIMHKYDLIGSMSMITGKYTEPAFYKAMKFGGVLLFDELDNSDPSAVVCFNVALSNGWFMFPNGERVTAHEDFVVVACGNTDMRGADASFNARRKMDGSVPARYFFSYWGYDNKLEMELAKQSGGDTANTRDWVERVQSLRAAAEVTGVRMNISQRASIKGAKLISKGFPTKKVEAGLVWQGLDKMQQRKVENSAREAAAAAA